ncbi:MAG: pantoate--beta-alanine ligase [Methylococcales bacterium]|nr:pantoate--beta-alanine ligase [Methylococcales bacterium]MDD5753492.1 pantoate--beta-alanine ligase [Methylococcales bacterium]
MKIIPTISDIRHCVQNWRNAGERIAFVPTMGNLHAGHLQLVREAKCHATKVIVSIFVNPTQFGVNEDFSDYPRTETRDCEQLAAEGCDLVFLPTVETIYVPTAQTFVSVSDISKNYCGATRAGHFDGVATVVCKLFNIVQPDVALFGLKDFQQFAVIQTLVRDLHLPIELIGVPTVRELDGLAMSSRNGYLNEQEREIAPQLYRTLQQAHDNLKFGQSIVDVENVAISELTQVGFVVDYFKVARRSNLQAAMPNDNALIILVAAKLGKTRLIDNLWLEK